MRLTDEQIAFYRRNGYLAGPRVLDGAQIERLRARIADILDGRVPFPDHLLGETVEKSRAKGQLPSFKLVNIFRHDAVFAEVLQHKAIASLASCLMPGPVRVWEDQMIFKPPHDEKAVLAWHQDYPYWNQVGPAELGTCWIALDDASIENGCMQVIPGSHRWKLDYAREEVDATDPDWLLKHPGIPRGADLTPHACEVKAGHCHFHHCLTIHGSHGNRTGNQRRSYILHLMPGSTRRIGNNWNSRQGDVEAVSIGEIVRGKDYPELAIA